MITRNIKPKAKTEIKTLLPTIKTKFAGMLTAAQAAIRRKTGLIIRATLSALCLGSCVALICYLQNFTVALDVSYNQRKLGCVQSQTQLVLAKEIVQRKVICEDEQLKPEITPEATPKIVRNEDVLSEDEMAQALIDESDDIVEAQGLYVGGDFVGAVETKAEIDTALDSALETHKTGAQNEHIIFADKVDVVPGVYVAKNVVPEEKLVSIITTEKKVPVETNREESVTEEIPYETQIIESDEYAVGTEKLVQEGVTGEKTKLYTVKLLDNVESSRAILRETITKAAVPEKILRGTADVMTAMSAQNSSAAGFIWPIENHIISSEFGYRWGTNHNGLDICDSDGDTFDAPIYAAAGGTVAQVLSQGESGGYGNLIVLDHGGGVTTYYAHTDYIVASVGQVVRQGEIVAYAGSTGDSTGAHLHFEVRTGGEPQNPMNYLG